MLKNPPANSDHVRDSGLCVCVCVCVKLLQSCPTLCNPVVCSPPGSSVPGILRAGIPEWVAMPSSRSLCLYRLSNLTHLFHTVYHDLSILSSCLETPITCVLYLYEL